MSKNFRHKDKHGSYELFFKDNMLRALVIGSIGESLFWHFHADLLTLIAREDSNPWGYYGDLFLCDGATCEAEQTMLKAHTFCIENGCCADAYRMKSPLVKDQIAWIRSKIGVKSNLDIQTFDNEKEALIFLHKKIVEYSHYHSDIK
jgi:hypothetical protein